MTKSAYKELTVGEKIFKDLVWNPLLAAGEASLESAVPFFSAPVVRQMEEGGLGLVSDWIFAQIIEIIDVEAIALVNSAHASAYEKASVQLKVLAYEKGITSKEFLRARDEARIALSKFTKITP